MGERRLKRIELSPEILMEICIPGEAFKCSSGLPDGAKFKGISHNYTNNTWNIFVEHPSFFPVEEGMEVPILPPPRFEIVQSVCRDPDDELADRTWAEDLGTREP